MSLEEVKQEVAEKLATVESALLKVEGVYRELQENARKVEQKIQESSDRQVEALRVRERQLVRQVQVVTYFDGEGLRSRQAGLMHKKGALTATRDLLNKCSPDDAHTLSKITVEDMDIPGEIQCMGEVTVQFDEAPISSAISKFGSVQLPERITHHTSPVIPTSVEEYDDGEHDVLHKSVAGSVCAPGAPVHVTVQFPRLANHAWLAKGQQGKTAKVPVVTPSNLVNKSEDVATWLTGLQIGAILDEEGEGATSDMITDNAQLPISSCSSSIEIVPSHFGSEKDTCSTPSSGMFEIENLHMYVGEKSRWLNTKQSPAKSPLAQQVKIDSVCQANEVCQSFKDCLCQNKCRDVAIEKLQQSVDYKAKVSRKRTISEVEVGCPVLAHMAKILASENSGWLVPQQMCPDLPIPVKRVMYQAPVDNWLKRTTCSTPTTTTSSRIQFSSHSNIWLLKNIKRQKTKDAQEKEESEKEIDQDEKESTITTDALTEALKKVTMSHGSETNTKWVLSKSAENSPKSPFSSRVTPLNPEQPWLLTTNLGSGRHARDNRLKEKDAANMKQWLSSSSKSSHMKEMLGSSAASEDSPVRKRLDEMSSSLPDTVLSVAQAGIKKWLIKNFN